MVWGHLIPGMRFIYMHKPVTSLTSNLISCSVHFCYLLDLFDGKWFRPSCIGIRFMNMRKHVHMCRPAPSSTSDLDLVTCSGHFCDLDCWLEMVWEHLFLGMRWIHLYIKACSFFASVLVSFQVSHNINTETFVFLPISLVPCILKKGFLVLLDFCLTP